MTNPRMTERKHLGWQDWRACVVNIILDSYHCSVCTFCHRQKKKSTLKASLPFSSNLLGGVIHDRAISVGIIKFQVQLEINRHSAKSVM